MKANVQRKKDAIYADVFGDYRQIFDVQARRRPKKSTIIFDFIMGFNKKSGDDVAALYQGSDRANPKTITVKVGHAQAFQDDFNAKFN